MIPPRHANARFILAACVFFASTVVPAVEKKSSPTSMMEKLPPSKLERLAALYLKLGQTDDCRATLQALFKSDRRNLDGLLLLARLELRLHRFPDSLRAATTALAISPDDADAMTLEAAALRAIGRIDDAARSVAGLAPSDVIRREETMGLIQPQAATSIEEAREDPLTASRGSRSDRLEELNDAALDAARAALRKGKLREAGTLTASALKQWPKDVEAIELRAEFLCEAGRPAESIPLYRKLKASHDASAGPFPRQMDLAFALNDARLTAEARAAFLVVMNDERYPAKDRASAARVLAEQRQTALLAEGTAALERGDNVEAARVCALLIGEKYDSDDVRVFHADVLHANGSHAGAAAIYASLKKGAPRARRFDSQFDYASSLAGASDYHAASSQYEEVIAQASFYTPDEVRVAREELENLHSNFFPRLSSELVAGTFDEGAILRLNSQFTSMRTGKRRYLAQAAWDRIELSETVFPLGRVAERPAASVGMWQELSPRWNATFLLGGYNDGVMASAAAEYTTTRDLAASVRLALNDPSRDTLLLEAMNGRQHSLSANLCSPLGRHFAFDATLLGRQIEIDGETIGRSVGVEAQFRWHPFTVAEDTWLAYAVEQKSFAARTREFDCLVRRYFDVGHSPLMPEVYDAVPERINRHALQAHTSVPLTRKLTAGMTAEIAHRLEADKTEYAIIGELKWKLTPRSELLARLEYDTGGAGPNTNGSVTIGTLGWSWSW